MAIVDEYGRRVNLRKGRIKVGDLGEFRADRDFREVCRKGYAKRRSELRKLKKEREKIEAEREAERIEFRGY